MRNLLIVATLVSFVLLTGCGQQKYGRGYGRPVFIRWVAHTTNGNPTDYYDITDTKVAKEEKILGTVTNRPANGADGWTADFQTSGKITIYSIPGLDLSKVIAVDLGNGSVVKAAFVGTKKP